MNLYENLNALAGREDLPFYKVVHHSEFDGHEYHVFSYMIATYEMWLLPDALESRGVMFRIEEGGPVIVSRPFKKFFNLGENPFTMNLKERLTKDNIEVIATKEDGSLISTYLDANGHLRCKSKTAITSTMALDAMEIMENCPDLKDECVKLENLGYTVIMEYVSPTNRIVLPYNAPALVVLGVRNRESGDLMSYQGMASIDGLRRYLVMDHSAHIEDPAKFILEKVPNMKGIEGFVVYLKDGTIFKVKTNEYVALHHAKDSITVPSRLMDVVLEEASDDLKQMFHNDPQAINEIENMERFVSELLTHLTKPVESFYEENKHLDRKSFAVKAKEVLDGDQFAIAMMRYSGKTFTARGFFKKSKMKEYLKSYNSTLTVDE